MNEGLLPIFSPNGIQHSLTISVLIGVLITSFMFERYGWVFSGLVVPGYLAPIFATYPMSAMAIVTEAALTYFIVKGFTAAAWKFRTHTPLFGRDRFFAAVLVALVVRLAMEELLLPWATHFFFPGRTDVIARVRDFGGIGLVVVPLTANIFWKPGIVKGLMQVVVCTAGTLLVLYLLLTPLTNYSLAQLGAVYEDVSLDFAKSAKLQMLIVCGCLLATRMNMQEGWDFGGILLPPLLAISLLQPTRLLGTVTETFLVVLIGQRLVQLPGMNRITWAGPRLVTFCFCVAVLVKIAVGWVFYFVHPQWNATDFLGFGYILSSLLAVKLWNKSSRVTLFPTLYVSAATFLLGTAVSFSLGAVWHWLEPITFAGSVAAAPKPESIPVEFALLERLSPGEAGVLDEQSVTTRRQISEAADAVLGELRRGSTPEEIVRYAAALLASSEAGVRYIRPEGAPPYAMLGPKDPESSDVETILIRLGPGTRTVMITAPGAEPLPTFLAAAALAKRLQPSVIVISTWVDPKELESAPRFDSLIAWALRALPLRPVLEIEGTATAGATLDIVGSLPEDVLSISDIRRVVPVLEVRTPERADDRRGRWLAANGRGGYQRLRIDLPGASALLIALVPDAESVAERMTPLETYLAPYLESMQARKPGLTLSPSEWTKARLIVLKAGLLRLMVEIQEASRGKLPEPADLAPLNFLARVLGLEIDLVQEPGGGRRFLTLRNQPGSPEIDGAVVLALGSWAELHVEVPSPRLYPNSHRLGTQVFLAGKCRALTIEGIGAPDAGIVAPDLAGKVDRISVFHIAHQVLVERASVVNSPPPRVLQVRGRRLPEEGNDGVLVPPDVVLPDAAAEGAETAPWARIFEDLGWKIRVQAPDEPHGFDVGSSLQARYRRFLRYEGVSGLWADPDVRRSLRGPKDDPGTVAALKQLGCEDAGTSVIDWWKKSGLEPGGALPVTVTEAIEGIAAFARTGNFGELAAALKEAREAGWRDALIVDRDADIPVVALVSADGAEGVLVNLAATTARGSELEASGRAADVESLLRLRRFFLVGRRP